MVPASAEAMPKRPLLRMCMATWKPLPSPPSRFSAGTFTSSKCTSAVLEHWIPIFCSGGPLQGTDTEGIGQITAAHHSRLRWAALPLREGTVMSFRMDEGGEDQSPRADHWRHCSSLLSQGPLDSPAHAPKRSLHYEGRDLVCFLPCGYILDASLGEHRENLGRAPIAGREVRQTRLAAGHQPWSPATSLGTTHATESSAQLSNPSPPPAPHLIQILLPLSV